MECQNIKVSSMYLEKLSKMKVSFHCGKDFCHIISDLDHILLLLSSWWNSSNMRILDEIQNRKHELPLKYSIILPNKLYIPSKIYFLSEQFNSRVPCFKMLPDFNVENFAANKKIRYLRYRIWEISEYVIKIFWKSSANLVRDC